MRPLTRVQCTVQQLCAALLILGPFAWLSLRWVVASGPQATPGSLWDIACLSLIFFGLLLQTVVINAIALLIIIR